MRRLHHLSARAAAIIAIALSSVLVSVVSAQSPAGRQTFSVGDALNVVSLFSVGSERRRAAGSRPSRRRGAMASASTTAAMATRPTSVRPPERCGSSRPPLESRARFSPTSGTYEASHGRRTASRLAMLVLHNESFQPVIWERATGRTTTVQPPAGSYVAENSDVRWTHDGASIVFSLHRDAWKTQRPRTVRPLHERTGVRAVEQRSVPRVG